MEGDIILLRQNKRTLSLREYFTTPQKDLQMPTFTLGTLGLKQPAQGKLKLYSFAPFRKQNGQEKRILTILSKLVFLLQELPSLSETKTRQVVGKENCFNCYFHTSEYMKYHIFHLRRKTALIRSGNCFRQNLERTVGVGGF